MHPIVGIPACARLVVKGQLLHDTPARYAAAVLGGAGAVPIMIPPMGEASLAVLDRLDGLLLSGSPSNVHPSHYDGGESLTPEHHDLERDATTLRLIPEADVKVIERCSGHGGSWGFKREWFDVAMKIGRPVARQAAAAGPGFVMSECPLAGVHIAQGMEKQTAEGPKPELVSHPVQVLAWAYGIGS